MKTLPAVVIVLIGLSRATAPVGAVEPKVAQPTPIADRPAESPKDLRGLIAKIRENEALFRDLAATVKLSRKLDQAGKKPEGEEIVGDGDGGHSVWRGTEHTLRIVTDVDQLFFSDDEAVSLGDDLKLTGKQVARFDGTQTLVIDEKSCAMLFHGRYQPGRMLPPHTWGLFTLDMGFPLSVYLEGTDALKAHPRGRWFPPGASLSEIQREDAGKVEAEWVGEEIVAELACVKVKVRRWGYNSDEPLLHYLWLARDRNFHVAQCQRIWLNNGVEALGETTQVEKWREIAHGVWLPALVTSQTNQISSTLSVEAVRLNPRGFPADFFALPPIPDALPKFVIGDDGRVEESPLHPTPARADPATTLELLLARLVEEERKFDRMEVTTVHDYELLTRSHVAQHATHSSEAHEMSVVAGERLLYSRELTARDARRAESSEFQQCHDGQSTRTLYRSPGATNAALLLGPADALQVVRPHTLLFRHGHEYRPLSQILKSGRFQSTKLVVEYLGDEQVGELHCHKLKCQLPVDHSEFILWLARDRNLIPVRRAWHRPGWAEKFPETLDVAEDLQEIGPGLWFPHRTTLFWFQFSREDGRPLPQWRQQIRVESLTLNSTVNDRFFREVEVPKGATVAVRDEQGVYIGRFHQPRAGNIDVRPEELRAMRRSARVTPEETERGKKDLDALIGRAASVLPADGWLNSPALSWDDLAGKVVVLNFWAHWSQASDVDLKRLAEYHQFLKDERITDRLLIGIHVAGSERDTVVREITDRRLGYPTVIDSPVEGGGAWGDLCDKCAVRQLPATIVIDRHGKIAAYGKLEDMLLKAADLSRDNSGSDSERRAR